MDNCKIKESKRMRSTPPSWSIGRIPAMCCPAVSFVFFKAVKAADIFRKADGFEYTHILAARKNKCSVDIRVYVVDALSGIFFLIQMAGRQFCWKRCDKIPPNKR